MYFSMAENWACSERYEEGEHIVHYSNQQNSREHTTHSEYSVCQRLHICPKTQ